MDICSVLFTFQIEASTLDNRRLVSTKDLDLHCDGFAVLGKIFRVTQGLQVIAYTIFAVISP